MENAAAKIAVIKRFLAFMNLSIAVKEARIATLGGEGLEATLWQEAGIPPEQGWLIERGRYFSQRLIRSQPYRFCPNLSTFPRVLRSILGRTASLDAFHLDLCGTLEPSVEPFRPVIPLLTEYSRGRCLAITVADERRNRTLERFDRVWRQATTFLGEQVACAVMEQLRQEQQQAVRPVSSALFEPVDPEKGARRELGVFVSLLDLLTNRHRRRVVLPDRVERYIYVSRWREHPFRMRTYFFHFGSALPRCAATIKKLGEQWMRSPLWMYNSGSFVRITVSPKLFEETRMPHDKLATIVAVLGGDVQQEFNELVRLAAIGSRAQQIADQLRVLTDGFLPANRPATTQPVAPREPPLESSSVKPENGDKVRLQLDLLRAKAQGEEALKRAYDDAYRRLDLTGRKYAKNRRRIVGAYMAYTDKTFRPKFLAQAIATLGEDVLTELAELYSAIHGESITVEMLHAQAQEA